MSNISAHRQKEEEQSADDKLAADLQAYREGSSQNPGAQLLFVGLAKYGWQAGTYFRNVAHSYSLLKKPLDTDRLLRDPRYKQDVEQAIKLVQRHEGKKKIDLGKSRYSAAIAHANEALKTVSSLHAQQIQAKIASTATSLPHIQKTYGLTPEESKVILKNAQEKLEKNPTASYHDFLIEEAHTLAKEKAIRTINQNTTLPKHQRKQELKTRLDILQEQKERIQQTTTAARQYELDRSEQVLQARRSNIPASPALTTPTPVPSLPSLPSLPSFSVPQRFSNAISTVSSSVSPGISQAISSMSSGLSSVTSSLGSLTNGFSGAIGDSVGSAFSNAAAKTAGSTALKAGTQAAIDAASGAVTAGVTFALDAISQLLFGQSFNELAVKSVLLLVIGVFIIILFFIFGDSSNSSSFSAGKTYSVEEAQSQPSTMVGWQQFERQSLLRVPTITTPLIGQQWEQFESRIIVWKH